MLPSPGRVHTLLCRRASKARRPPLPRSCCAPHLRLPSLTSQIERRGRGGSEPIPNSTAIPQILTQLKSRAGRSKTWLAEVRLSIEALRVPATAASGEPQLYHVHFALPFMTVYGKVARPDPRQTKENCHSYPNSPITIFGKAQKITPIRQPNDAGRSREDLMADEVERMITAARQSDGRLADVMPCSS